MGKNRRMNIDDYMDPDLIDDGSADQATQDFNEADFVLSDVIRYSLNDFKTKLNNNVLIEGGSGTGKTTNVVVPNIRQAVGSYFICDPKGQLYKRWGKYLRDHDYTVKLIDFTHPEKSGGYNPMNYLKSTQDITKLASTITYSNGSENGKNIDPYWDRMTILLLSAIIGYLVETDSPNKTFSAILDMVNLGEREDDEDKDSKLRRLFVKHKFQNPNSWACKKFESVDAAPFKTYDTIRSTLSAKFAVFDSKELRRMMEKPSIDFTEAAKKKTAVFVTVSDSDRTMDTLVNIFFTQAMNELCQYADDECKDGRLPIPVRFILDDFATNCRIEEFPRMISSIRSRAISVMLMIQAEAQLVQGYGYDAQTIISNCDTFVYLGGNDVQTAYSIAERCDKPMCEILYMPVGHCWVFRRGSKPKSVVLPMLEQPEKAMEQSEER